MLEIFCIYNWNQQHKIPFYKFIFVVYCCYKNFKYLISVRVDLNKIFKSVLNNVTKFLFVIFFILFYRAEQTDAIPHIWSPTPHPLNWTLPYKNSYRWCFTNWKHCSQLAEVFIFRLHSRAVVLKFLRY